MKIRDVIKCIILLLFYIMIAFISGKLMSGCIVMLLMGEYKILALMVIALCLYTLWNVYKDVCKECIAIYSNGGVV